MPWPTFWPSSIVAQYILSFGIGVLIGIFLSKQFRLLRHVLLVAIIIWIGWYIPIVGDIALGLVGIAVGAYIMHQALPPKEQAFSVKRRNFRR
jgi:hypothetical protein